MSYEGYEQNICANGHYTNKSSGYEDMYDIASVCHCGANFMWINYVDDTNCNNYGFIPDLFLRHESWGKYHIPIQNEYDKYQTFNLGKGPIFIHSGKDAILPTYIICEYNIENCTYYKSQMVCSNPQVNACTTCTTRTTTCTN